MPALEPETVHPLRLSHRAQPDADEHHVVHDCRARRDVASEVELPEQRTRPGIERPKLTRAGHATAPFGVEGEDVRRPGEGSGVDLPERDPRRRAYPAGDPSRHHRLLPDGSAGVAIDGVVDAVLAPDPTRALGVVPPGMVNRLGDAMKSRSPRFPLGIGEKSHRSAPVSDTPPLPESIAADEVTPPPKGG